MDETIIDEICEVIAKHIPFSPQEIKAVYKTRSSVEHVMAVAHLAQERGISLSSAHKVTEEYFYGLRQRP